MAKKEISHEELAHTVPFTEVTIPTIQESQESRDAGQGSNTRETDGVDPSPSSEESVLRLMQVRKRRRHECPRPPTSALCSSQGLRTGGRAPHWGWWPALLSHPFKRSFPWATASRTHPELTFSQTSAPLTQGVKLTQKINHDRILFSKRLHVVSILASQVA